MRELLETSHAVHFTMNVFSYDEAIYPLHLSPHNGAHPINLLLIFKVIDSEACSPLCMD